MGFIKHVGKHGDRKVAIVYRTVPDEEHMALVIYPETLSRGFHDSVMKVIESEVGQSAEQLAVAKDRIKKLFSEAAAVFKKDSSKADRYIHLARKLAMKYKVKFTSGQKRKFCKHCYKYLVPSVNSRVRLKDKKVITYCLICKKYSRFVYKK